MKRDKRTSLSTFNNKNGNNGKHNALTSSLKEKEKGMVRVMNFVCLH